MGELQFRSNLLKWKVKLKRNKKNRIKIGNWIH